MVWATKIRLDIFQSCSVLSSHWVMDVEFESVIAVQTSVFALKLGARSFPRRSFPRRSFPRAIFPTRSFPR